MHKQIYTEKGARPGGPYSQAIVAEGAELQRYDYSLSAWQGPPEGSLGWWKSQMPDLNARRVHWAPNDVMLQYFEELEQQPGRQDTRYVLAILLVRRRVMRQEETGQDEQGRDVMVLYCPRRDATYKVRAVTPDESRTAQIQEEMAELLFAKAT